MKYGTSPGVHGSEWAEANDNKLSEKAKARLTMTQTDEHPVVENGYGANEKPALDRIDFVRDDHNRVVFYEHDKGAWNVRGTGHVVCVQSRDQPDAWWIIVRLESNEKNIFESRILADTNYQKHHGNWIGWSEPDDCDLALCFHEKAGCKDIWDKICQIQGKNPGVEIMDNRNNYITVSEKLRASDARNLQLMTEIQEISGKYQTSTEELKMAQGQIRQLEIKIQEKQAPMAQLIAVLKETTQKVEEMASQEGLLKSAEAEAEKMKAELKKKEMEAGKMAGENAALKDQNKNFVVKIRQMEQKMAEFEAKIDGFDAKTKREVDKKETLVKELQTELEKCRKEAEEAVNARSQVFKTLTDLIPQLTPQLTPSKPEKRRFSVPAQKVTIPAPSEAKYYQYKDKDNIVYRDGYLYYFQQNLKSHPSFKIRMQCSRQHPRCNGYIWITGEWETDSRGRLYQRGILRGGHSHDAQEQFLTQDETAHVGGLVDEKQFLTQDETVLVGGPMFLPHVPFISTIGTEECRKNQSFNEDDDVVLIREIVNDEKQQSQDSGSDSGPAKRARMDTPKKSWCYPWEAGAKNAANVASGRNTDIHF